MSIKKKLLIVGLGYITETFIKHYANDFKIHLLSNHKKSSSKQYELISLKELGKYDFDNVIFASSVSSFKEPTESELERFLEYTKKVVKNISKNYLKKIIYLSSSAVYGIGSNPFTENSEIIKNTKYQREKTEVESIFLSDDFLCNKAIIFRISNPYGSIKEVKSENGVINIIFNNFKIKQKTIINSKHSIRDFIHIKDVIKCINYALSSEFNSGVYNLGSGESSTLGSVVNESKKTLFDIELEFGNSERTESLLNIDKLKNMFKTFSPTPLKEGIKKFYG